MSKFGQNLQKKVGKVVLFCLFDRKLVKMLGLSKKKVKILGFERSKIVKILR